MALPAAWPIHPLTAPAALADARPIQLLTAPTVLADALPSHPLARLYNDSLGAGRVEPTEVFVCWEGEVWNEVAVAVILDRR